MEPEVDVPLDGSDEDVLDKTLSASFTDEIEPLMPVLDFQGSANSDDRYDDSRREELKAKLTNALKKLEESEQSIDASWSLGNSLTSVKDELAIIEEKLPKHVQDNVKGIILSAQEYIGKLEDQLSDLDIADEQVCSILNEKRNF